MPPRKSSNLATVDNFPPPEPESSDSSDSADPDQPSTSKKKSKKAKKIGVKTRSVKDKNTALSNDAHHEIEEILEQGIAFCPESGKNELIDLLRWKNAQCWHRNVYAPDLEPKKWVGSSVKLDIPLSTAGKSAQSVEAKRRRKLINEKITCCRAVGCGFTSRETSRVTEHEKTCKSVGGYKHFGLVCGCNITCPRADRFIHRTPLPRGRRKITAEPLRAYELNQPLMKGFDDTEDGKRKKAQEERAVERARLAYQKADEMMTRQLHQSSSSPEPPVEASIEREDEEAPQVPVVHIVVGESTQQTSSSNVIRIGESIN